MKKNLSLKDVQYVKVTYDDRWENSHCSKAAITSVTQRELTVSIKYEDYIFIRVPQKVQLGFVCEDGFYKTTTNLKSVDNKDPYILLHLEMPENIQYQQNREYFRVNILEGAILSFQKGEEKLRYTCKTHDISAKGVALELPQRIDIPETVNINILMENRELKLNAKFIRIMVQDGDKLRASFEFSDLSEQDKDFISKICLQKQIANRRDKAD